MMQRAHELHFARRPHLRSCIKKIKDSIIKNDNKTRRPTKLKNHTSQNLIYLTSPVQQYRPCKNVFFSRFLTATAHPFNLNSPIRTTPLWPAPKTPFSLSTKKKKKKRNKSLWACMLQFPPRQFSLPRWHRLIFSTMRIQKRKTKRAHLLHLHWGSHLQLTALPLDESHVFESPRWKESLVCPKPET